ncbi:MAG: RDD family protein [Gammaproteobacteria bacterium]
MEETTLGATPDKNEVKSENVLPSSYAWRRYFARAVDMSVIITVIIFILIFFSTIAVILVYRAGAHTYLGWIQSLLSINHFLDVFITVTLWLPIEALFLSSLGTTPGKWVFGINVRTQAGKNLSYWTALSRAAIVFIKGQGLTIPLLSLITLIVSYDRLVKTGSTSWDKDLGTTVGYAKMTDARLVCCIFAVILWALYTGAGLISFVAKLR